MNVLLLGATGLVGGECLTLLLQEPSVTGVKVYARSPLSVQHPKLTVLTAPLDAIGVHGSFFAADAVLCALGTTIKKAGSQPAFRAVDHDAPLAAAVAARSQGCRHYLLVSALGADARSSVFYNRVKGETENAVIALGLPATTILRPSLLLGNRKEFRPAERIGALFTPFIPKKYRPVHASAVARRMVTALSRTDSGTRIIESAEI
ncbi:MAG: NAD(P)H-binding protein [Bacteroidetes bacterium]|nr:NAD(P)H-binding protein [Bacteroidota bacterium]